MEINWVEAEAVTEKTADQLLHDDFEKSPDPDTSEVRRCLDQRIVDVPERPIHIDEDQRIEFERLHQKDTAKPINAAYADTQHFFKELGHHTGTAKQQNPRIRSDERRRHDWNCLYHNFPLMGSTEMDFIFRAIAGHSRAGAANI